MTLTTEQVQAQATAIRRRSGAGSHVLALQHGGAWNGPSRMDVAGEEHDIIACVSDLQIREALSRLEANHRSGIILCALDSAALGEDVLARLAKRRIHHPKIDEMLRELFSARLIDARVLSCKPLVDALIRGAGSGAYLPPPSGTLDLNSAWRALLRNLLKREVSEITLLELLRWTMQEASRAALLRLDPAVRAELARWMAPSCGDAPRCLLKALDGELGKDLVALGLLLGALLAAEREGLPEAKAAAARLEQFFGNEVVSAATKRAWYQASEGLLRSLAETEIFQAKEILQNLDRLIERVRLQAHADLSDYSNLGLDMRFGQVGDAIVRAIQARDDSALLSARELLDRVSQHFLAPGETVRLRRLQMAARLLAWMRVTPKTAPNWTFSQFIGTYYVDGGFVEWARNLVTESDPNQKVKAALHATLEVVDAEWNVVQKSFAERLQHWTAQGGDLNGVLRIEDVLLDVVGPVAKQMPVLLVVLDGMSMAVFRELLGDLLRRNWVEVSPASELGHRPVLATIPSVTEVSRRALLSGQLPVPAQGTEKSDFARNEKLFETIGGSMRPQLFLKGDLLETGRSGLSASVSQAIANTRCRLVGVVVNAIDDTLGSSDQTSYTWTLDQITPLHELLRLASEAGRLVILTSDHGHVLDGGSELVRQPLDETGDRYRLPSGSLTEGELLFSGPRIRAAVGSESIVALAAQRRRYQSKRRGYHGGVCPAEMVVPCSILRSIHTDLPETWHDLPPYEPEWWSLRTEPEARTSALTPSQPSPFPVRPHRTDAQGELFQQQPAGTPTGTSLAEQVLSSQVYGAQVRQTVRGAPPVDQIRQFITLLEQRNGRVLRGQLAQELQIPLLRVDGLIQNYRRLLNVDGYDVLSYDQSSETIALNIQLLKSQFEL